MPIHAHEQAIKGFRVKRSKVTLAAKSRHEEITSPNVVAVLEGSDPKLKDEFVVFSAHLRSHRYFDNTAITKTKLTMVR